MTLLLRHPGCRGGSPAVLPTVEDGRGRLGGLPLPAGTVVPRDPAAGHQDTSRPVSQPAFSNAARASWVVRCP